MSRTDIDAATLADYLRQMCGDGSVEWSYEPMQTSVLLDVADMLDENAKLRELLRDAWGNGHPDKSCGDCEIIAECNAEIEEARKKGNGRWNTRCLFERRIEERMRELGIEVTE